MDISRRAFFGIVGTGVGGLLAAKATPARAARKAKAPADPYGCLVDLTLCVGCRKCEVTCNRCHRDKRDVDFRKLAASGTDFAWMKSRGRDVSDLIGTTDFIGFKALGYKGDPIVQGGRFKQLPLGASSGMNDGSKVPPRKSR